MLSRFKESVIDTCMTIVGYDMAKIRNNAETEKHFSQINADKPINKGK